MIFDKIMRALWMLAAVFFLGMSATILIAELFGVYTGASSEQRWLIVLTGLVCVLLSKE